MTVQMIDAEISVLLRAFKQTREQITAAAETIGRDPADLSTLADAITERIDELLRIRVERLSEILTLADPLQRQVMILRDVSGLKWNDVALEAHLSLRHVHRVYKDASQALRNNG